MHVYVARPSQQNISLIPHPAGMLQRKSLRGDHKPLVLQRRPVNGLTQKEAPPIVHEVLHGNGRALDPDTRAFMEPQFAHDFSKVRVHTDAKAAESARSVNAAAYTVGHDVVFNSGQYAPAQHAGRQLLAHELTHVVQQSGAAPTETALRIGETDTPQEREADSRAGRLMTAQPPMQQTQLPPAAGASVLQRQVPGAPSFLPPLNLPSEVVMINQGESITPENTKLVNLATAYKQLAATHPGEYIKLSTYLSEASKLDSAKADKEATQLKLRMMAVQAALVKLGVPADAVHIEQATIFSTNSAAQITASLYKSTMALPLLPPGPAAAPASPGSAAAPSGSSLGDLLSFKFSAGPLLFAVELPKSVAIKLPVAISAAKMLSFELKAESSGEFSFSIALNGLRHLSVSAKASLKVDKDKGTNGSAGLEITTTKTVCNAPSPESLKAKVTSAGEKLTKAMKELETAKPDERLSKMADIAGAIGEMYDAVDKAKSACTEVPRATFSLGVQAPLSPTTAALNDPDPSKRPPSYLGGSFTFRF